MGQDIPERLENNNINDVDKCGTRLEEATKKKVILFCVHGTEPTSKKKTVVPSAVYTVSTSFSRPLFLMLLHVRLAPEAPPSHARDFTETLPAFSFYFRPPSLLWWLMGSPRNCMSRRRELDGGSLEPTTASDTSPDEVASRAVYAGVCGGQLSAVWSDAGDTLSA